VLVRSRGRRTVLFATLASSSILVLTGSLPSCSGSKDSSVKSINSPAQQTLSLPPNTCRFAGTIVAVLPPDSAEGGGPCSKAPCTADVRIDSVLGYGSAFPYPLAAGTVVRMRFAYTLTPSTTLFPGVQALPSPLVAGDALNGVLEGMEGLAKGPGSPMSFTVSTYQKK